MIMMHYGIEPFQMGFKCRRWLFTRKIVCWLYSMHMQIMHSWLHM